MFCSVFVKISTSEPNGVSTTVNRRRIRTFLTKHSPDPLAEHFKMPWSFSSVPQIYRAEKQQNCFSGFISLGQSKTRKHEANFLNNTEVIRGKWVFWETIASSKLTSCGVHCTNKPPRWHQLGIFCFARHQNFIEKARQGEFRSNHPLAKVLTKTHLQSCAFWISSANLMKYHCCLNHSEKS